MKGYRPIGGPETSEGLNPPMYFPKDSEVIFTSISKENISYNMNEKLELHKDLCEFMHKLYKTKNRDYGDSMHPLFEEYGLTAFLVMFSIKINRIKSLVEKESANYESLEDSLMDLANYALIAITELKYKSKNSDK